MKLYKQIPKILQEFHSKLDDAIVLFRWAYKINSAYDPSIEKF